MKDNSEKYRFNVEFSSEALDFLTNLDRKTREKILENIRISRFTNDPRLLKKIDKEIWEFRTNYNSKQIRLLAFWDKESKSLIIATHGLVKKTQKLPAKELKRAKEIRNRYLNSKNKK